VGKASSYEVSASDFIKDEDGGNDFASGEDREEGLVENEGGES
jgi:hypothetical protein